MGCIHKTAKWNKQEEEKEIRKKEFKKKREGEREQMI